MRFIQVTVLLVFLMAIAVFAVQNNEAVAVKFLVWKATAPMALMIVTIYLFGMVSGGAVLGFIRRSIRKASERPADYQA
ncbi:lipopolysaccharide assembly protein LapA domain-containing protein [Tundrisphaera sp. TA3]|uniref:lipopolysaccharide assembly protein LapA domain-containing protein n=1 Tax=Tundrisphaera sp. TA3 TaxID=3435775 RepID=UPI003EBFEAA5